MAAFNISDVSVRRGGNRAVDSSKLEPPQRDCDKFRSSEGRQHLAATVCVKCYARGEFRFHLNCIRPTTISETFVG